MYGQKWSRKERLEDAVLWTWRMEEGSQGMRVATSSWRRHGRHSLLEPLEEAASAHTSSLGLAISRTAS